MTCSPRYQKLIVSLCSAAAFGLLTYFIFQYYSIGDRPWLFYNSDNIYLPYLYRDLVIRHGSILQWAFSPVPYFFPDAVIYFILAAMVQHLQLAILLYAVIQLMLYYWLIVAIGKMTARNTQKLVLFRLSVFISLLLLATGYLQQETLNYALISQQHFGATLMFLLSLLLILRTFSSKNPINYWLLFIVCFLTACSDITYIIQFVTTAIASLVIMMMLSSKHEEKTIYTTTIFVLIVSTTLSYLLYKASFFYLNITFDEAPLKRFHLIDLEGAAEKIYQNLAIFYQKNTAVFILLVGYATISLIFLAHLIWKKNNNTKNNAFVFTIIILLMAILIGYLNLLFFDNNLMVDGYEGLRHSQVWILLPVFLGIPLYLSHYTHLETLLSKYYIYFIVLILSIAYLVTPKGSINNIINFYPPSIACLDQYAEQYHLQNGMTNSYWPAKSYSFLSRKPLNIVFVLNNTPTSLVPKPWVTTLHDYVKKDFNFLVVYYYYPEGNILNSTSSSLFETPGEKKDRFLAANDIKEIHQKLGPSILELTCPSPQPNNQYKIYVYKKAASNVHAKFIYFS